MHTLSQPSRLIGLATLILALVAPSAVIGRQTPVATFRSGVALVPISAIVRDGRNRLVLNLKRDDFQVFEDNRPKPIVDFRATVGGPITVALLLDTSGSMNGPNLDAALAVARRVLEQVQAAGDEVALFTFDRRLRQEVPFTNDPEIVRRALPSVRAWGLTSLYDAIAGTARAVADQPARQRCVLVITDGGDTSSALSVSEVAELAAAIDVPVYVVAVLPPEHPAMPVGRSRNDALSRLALFTGGRLAHASTPALAAQAIDVLVAELRHQYFLAIESATETGWRPLLVRARHGSLSVRSRTGYLALGTP